MNIKKHLKSPPRVPLYWLVTTVGRNLAPVDSLSHNLHGFVHLRWCRISSNTTDPYTNLLVYYNPPSCDMFISLRWTWCCYVLFLLISLNPPRCSTFRCFRKWWYPQNTQVMIIFSRKANGCWVPPFLETPISVWSFWDKLIPPKSGEAVMAATILEMR